MNAASLMPSQLAGGAIARGSIFRITGVHLGPEKPDASSVAVTVRSGAAAATARVTYASDTRIEAILPRNAPVGDAYLNVTFDGQTSAPFPIRVAESSFGIFPSVDRTAAPGETVTIRGTGLGSVRNPEVLLGGRAVRASYAGPRAKHAGEDEIRFQVPRDAAQGCLVPVEVRSRGVWSNVAGIAVAPKRQRCVSTAPWLDSESVVLLVRARIGVSILQFSEDLALATFGRALDLPLPPAGVCTGYTRSFSTEEWNEWLKARGVEYTDAGTIHIIGPRGDKGIIRRPRGPFGYWNTLGGGIPGPRRHLDPLFLDPGAYQVRGRDFESTVFLPPMLEWTNRAQLDVIDRTADVAFHWKAAPPADRIVIAVTNLDQATGAFGLAMCVAPGDVQDFIMPARMLANLPAVTGAGQFPLNLALVAHLPALTPSSSHVSAAYVSLEARTVNLR